MDSPQFNQDVLGHRHLASVWPASHQRARICWLLKSMRSSGVCRKEPRQTAEMWATPHLLPGVHYVFCSETILLIVDCWCHSKFTFVQVLLYVRFLLQKQNWRHSGKSVRGSGGDLDPVQAYLEAHPQTLLRRNGIATNPVLPWCSLHRMLYNYARAKRELELKPYCVLLRNRKCGISFQIHETFLRTSSMY